MLVGSVIGAGESPVTLAVTDGALIHGSSYLRNVVGILNGEISVSGIDVSGTRSTIEAEAFEMRSSYFAPPVTGGITDGGLVTAYDLILNGSQLTVSGQHHTGVRSELHVQGQADIGRNDPASLTALDGGLIQIPYLQIYDNAVVTSSGSGSEIYLHGLYSHGTLQALDGGTIIVQGTQAQLAGTIRVSGEGSRIDLSSDNVHLSYFLEVQDGGALYLPADVSTQVFSHITGDGGTIVGDLESWYIIAPGNSTGVLTIDGDLQNFGTIILELAGLADFDQLLISGALTLNNDTIQIELLDGFSPHSGAEFQVMKFAELAFFGETNLADVFDFSQATLAPGLSWDFSDFATTGTIRVVPEPSTLLLGTLALLGGVWLRRRSILRHS